MRHSRLKTYRGNTRDDRCKRDSHSPYIVTLFFVIVVAPFVAGSSRNSLLRLASKAYVLSTYLPWYAQVDRCILTSRDVLACTHICVYVYVCIGTMAVDPPRRRAARLRAHCVSLARLRACRWCTCTYTYSALNISSQS